MVCIYFLVGTCQIKVDYQVFIIIYNQRSELFMLIILALLAVIAPITIQHRGKLSKNFGSQSVTKIFSDYGGIDKVLRIFQYVFLWFIGYLEEVSKYSYNHSGLLMISQANRVSKLVAYMSQTRKVIRFVRAPMIFLNIKNKKLGLNFSTVETTIKSLEDMAIFCCQIADFLFFFTDHYNSFYLLGILNGKEHNQAMSINGHYMWVTAETFRATSVILKTIRFYFYGPKITRKGACWLLADFCASLIEIFVGLTFLDPSLASKRIFSTFIIINCTYKLGKMTVV